MALIRARLAAVLAGALLATPAWSQTPPAAPSPSAPGPAAPGAAAPNTAAPASPGAAEAEPPADGDTWIFSGVLRETGETFSGTLVTGKSGVQFELKLANGATCDGGDLRPSMGLVRLSEIECTDGRPMRGLFVPQAHETLKVFGNVGDARFSTVAHILGTQAIPEPKQTTAPQAPPPEKPAEPPPPSNRTPGEDPG